MKVMSGMEKQLNDFAAREESVAQVRLGSAGNAGNGRCAPAALAVAVASNAEQLCHMRTRLLAIAKRRLRMRYSRGIRPSLARSRAGEDTTLVHRRLLPNAELVPWMWIARRQELARLLESRRKDSEEQEQQHEGAVSALRVKFSGQLQEREKEYQTLSLQHTDMSSKMERLVREKRHAETQVRACH